MSEADVIEAVRQALHAALMISMPVLIVATGVGLLIALFQALTQIQELTLTFVPKFIAVMGCAIALAPTFFLSLQTFMEFAIDRVANG